MHTWRLALSVMFCVLLMGGVLWGQQSCGSGGCRMVKFVIYPSTADCSCDENAFTSTCMPGGGPQSTCMTSCVTCCGGNQYTVGNEGASDTCPSGGGDDGYGGYVGENRFYRSYQPPVLVSASCSNAPLRGVDALVAYEGKSANKAVLVSQDTKMRVP